MAGATTPAPQAFHILHARRRWNLARPLRELQRREVFWFFFSKKNGFAYLPHLIFVAYSVGMGLRHRH